MGSSLLCPNGSIYCRGSKCSALHSCAWIIVSTVIVFFVWIGVTLLFPYSWRSFFKRSKSSSFTLSQPACLCHQYFTNIHWSVWDHSQVDSFCIHCIIAITSKYSGPLKLHTANHFFSLICNIIEGLLCFSVSFPATIHTTPSWNDASVAIKIFWLLSICCSAFSNACCWSLFLSSLMISRSLKITTAFLN